MVRRPDARQTLPVPCMNPSAPALRPVSPRSAHGERAQFGVPTTVRSDRPAPKCPSHNASALCEPVCAIYEARQLRSAHGGRVQFSIPTTNVRRYRLAPECPSHDSSEPFDPVCASREARQPRQRARRASPDRHLSPRPLFEAIARRPDARHTLPVHFESPKTTALRVSWQCRPVEA